MNLFGMVFDVFFGQKINAGCAMQNTVSIAMHAHFGQLVVLARLEQSSIVAFVVLELRSYPIRRLDCV